MCSHCSADRQTQYLLCLLSGSEGNDFAGSGSSPKNVRVFCSQLGVDVVADMPYRCDEKQPVCVLTFCVSIILCCERAACS